MLDENVGWFRAACLVMSTVILQKQIFAKPEVSGLGLHHGRFLTQLLDAQSLPNPSSTSNFVAENSILVFSISGGLCVVLFIALIVQWVTEVMAWRRGQHRDAQKVAHEQHHADVIDLEKSEIHADIKGAEGGGHRVHDHPALTAQTTQTATMSTAIAPRPALIKTISSSASVRRSLSLRHHSLSRSIIKRNSSGIILSSPRIRPGTSLSSPSSRALTPSKHLQLTLDESVKNRDVNATGWVSHPFAKSSTEGSPLTSGACTPTTCATSPIVLSLPSRHLERSGEVFKHSTRAGLYKNLSRRNSYRKELLGAAENENFKLTTSVAEDDGGDVDVQHDHRAPSKSSNDNEQSYLATAQSIKPRDILQDQQETQQHQPENNKSEHPGDADDDFSSSSGFPSTVQRIDHRRRIEQEQFLKNNANHPNDAGSNASMQSIIGGNNLTVLSPEEFDDQVRYIRILGSGGAGTVYEAMWRGQPVAVKSIHPTRQRSQSALESFAKEVAMMSKLGSHECIISVYGACMTPGHLALILELAERGSLHSILHEEGLRPRYGTFLSLAESVASALAHCHALKLVHRDLKSNNVLIDGLGRAKVADFGLAAPKNRTFLTVEHGALGTASVMAPEQFEANQVSERCDSYAFGCLLWEMLTGRMLWEECSNVMQIVMAVGCERRRPAMPPGAPPPLSRLIQECWRHNPALRPGFTEILDRLREMRTKVDGIRDLDVGDSDSDDDDVAGGDVLQDSRKKLSKLSRLAVSSSNDAVLSAT